MLPSLFVEVYLYNHIQFRATSILIHSQLHREHLKFIQSLESSAASKKEAPSKKVHGTPNFTQI